MTEKVYNEISKIIRSSIKINDSDYDDLIHDTILRLYQKDIRDIEDCKKLCYIVARNIYFDKKRKEKNFKYVYDANAELPTTQKQKKEIIYPIKYRHFFIMKYKLGMSLVEISTFTNRKYSTIRGDHMKMKQEFRELNKTI
jgi:DNA-directed RNA polymerase specialized sigma24 family protein